MVKAVKYVLGGESVGVLGEKRQSIVPDLIPAGKARLHAEMIRARRAYASDFLTVVPFRHVLKSRRIFRNFLDSDEHT
jgi:hypothetical protein